MLRLEVPVALPAIAAAQDRVEAWLAGQGVPPATAYRVRLVIEEVLANLCEHGRFAGPPPASRLELALAAGEVCLVIEDGAAPFDPILAPPPDAPTLADDRVGGLGLALVRKMAARIAYGRTANGWNRSEFGIAVAGRGDGAA
jgi:anti-sigma regulatory factor (Ser/Thr protein kinase)